MISLDGFHLRENRTPFEQLESMWDKHTWTTPGPIIRPRQSALIPKILVKKRATFRWLALITISSL
ncbi:hypothetical protein BH09BAC3_BH09BAC3_33120 [soil metagenome]